MPDIGFFRLGKAFRLGRVRRPDRNTPKRKLRGICFPAGQTASCPCRYLRAAAQGLVLCAECRVSCVVCQVSYAEYRVRRAVAFAGFFVLFLFFLSGLVYICVHGLSVVV